MRQEPNTGADKIGWKKSEQTYLFVKAIIVLEPQAKSMQKEEERRLLSLSAKCHAEERAVADQLSHARPNALYPAYMQLVDAYQAIRIECREKRNAVKIYRKKMREERK